MLEIEPKEIITLAKKYPQIFYMKSETVVKKIKLIKYYKNLQKKFDSKLTYDYSSCENLYKKIFINLLKQYCNNKSINSKTFINYIVSNSDKTFEFNLPESEYNEEFIEYVKKIFIQNTKKCNVKFKIHKILK